MFCSRCRYDGIHSHTTADDCIAALREELDALAERVLDLEVTLRGYAAYGPPQPPGATDPRPASEPRS